MQTATKEQKPDIRTIAGRIEIVNSIIFKISSIGRHFFLYRGRTAFIFMKDKKLFMKSEYDESDMQLPFSESERPEGWIHGGTMIGLVKDFCEFINTGTYTNGNNGRGGLFCVHWGYLPSEMEAIRKLAFELDYLEKLTF